MYIQIVNTTLTKYNIIRTEVTKSNAVRNISSITKAMQWKLSDCTTKQLRDDLVNKIYRGVDGKNIPAGTRQYKSRARVNGTLNVKKNKPIPVAVAA